MSVCSPLPDELLLLENGSAACSKSAGTIEGG